MNDSNAKTQAKYCLKSAADWGREVAVIDNEKLRGVWRENSWRHREAIMLEMAALPDDVLGREAWRRFAESYDATIDLSVHLHFERVLA